MIKHIVVYTLREGVNHAQAVKKIASLLEPLVGKIPGLIHLEVRQTYQGGMDYCLYSEFESEKALDDYQNHPLHVAAKGEFSDLLATRVCADYKA